MSKLQRVLTEAVPPGIYQLTSRTPAKALAQQAQDAGWQMYVLDGNQISDKQTFLAQIATVMKFPAYFGKNWDALYDCLTDMEWARGSRSILLLQASANFSKSNPADWDVAIKVLTDAIKFWQDLGVAFYVLVRGSSPGSFPSL